MTRCARDEWIIKRESLYWDGEWWVTGQRNARRYADTATARKYARKVGGRVIVLRIAAD